MQLAQHARSLVSRAMYTRANYINVTIIMSLPDNNIVAKNPGANESYKSLSYIPTKRYFLG